MIKIFINSGSSSWEDNIRSGIQEVTRLVDLVTVSIRNLKADHYIY
jgi:hypothetical protein